MKNKPIFAVEHRQIGLDEVPGDFRVWLDGQELSDGKNNRLLGLQKTARGFTSGNFVGAVWIGADGCQTPLIVRSKFEQMDYMAMYLACAEDSVIGGKLRECFDFWPEEPLIESAELPKMSELLVAAYLRELNELCTRHLRRHFLRVTENLRGKVKGKILLHQQVKKNLRYGRQDRVFCSYQTINNDIAENRVLRAALEQSAKFLNARRQPHPCLYRWIHASRAALSGVSVVAVKKADFRHLRVRGAFSHYRRAITMAKFILLRLGTNPHTEIRDNIATPPFAINSAELFERYAEKILREKYPNLAAGYGYLEGRNIYGDRAGFNVTVRPDFWVPADADGVARVMDAKYKDKQQIEKESDGDGEDAAQSQSVKPSREDVFQIVAYSQHRKLRQNKLNADENSRVELALVYPDFEQADKIRKVRTDESFYPPLSMWFVRCPVVGEQTESQHAA